MADTSDAASRSGPAVSRAAAFRAIALDDVADDPEQFVRAVEGLIEAFRWWAHGHKRNYNWLRSALIVLSATLPALAAVPGPSVTMRVVASVVSVLVAILAGLEGFYRPAQLWQHSKTAEMTLRGLLRQYRRAVLALKEFPGGPWSRRGSSCISTSSPPSAAPGRRRRSSSSRRGSAKCPAPRRVPTEGCPTGRAR